MVSVKRCIISNKKKMYNLGELSTNLIPKCNTLDGNISNLWCSLLSKKNICGVRFIIMLRYQFVFSVYED